MIKTRTKIKIFKQPYLYLLENDCNSYMENLDVKMYNLCLMIERGTTWQL